ncbi:MAG TPA: hypothetical protein VF490_15200 [Chryseosolibacter sp.]
MKGSIVLTILCLGFCLVSCQESREDAKTPSVKDFYKTIGEEIPFETGMEWIDNYQKKMSTGRTEILYNYYVSASEMRAVLGCTSDLVGVAFHWGTDALGMTHIILIPVDGSMSLWTPVSGRVFVDANTNTEISQQVASTWAAAYKNAHPNDVWFHFFGKYIFDDMTALPYFNSVDIEPGINSVDLTPQMLLVVWDESLNLLGRTNSQSATVYDASNACPPCAVQ